MRISDWSSDVCSSDLPYWEGVSRRGAIAQAMRRYHEVQARFPDKAIVIGEIGWPSNGDRFRNAIASRSKEGLFIREFLREAKRQHIDYFLEEALDQPGKEDRSEEGRVGKDGVSPCEARWWRGQ